MTISRLIIGLDFGTTYTGVSFSEATDDGSETKQVHVIRDWPSRHTKIGTKEKVPSEIAYIQDGTEYGSNIAPNQPRQIWMKLQLDRQQLGASTKFKRELTSVNESTKKRPVEIIADFLRHIKEHLVKNLDEQYGEKLWKTLPLVLVITVPAVWSDLAKSRTMEAVRGAGFSEKGFRNLTKTITITEPEAAALYTIKTLRGGAQDKELDIGDGIVVCDMGGGTVDLISYRISKLQPTAVEEVTVGNGDLCGGSFVDRAFIKWLEDKLGVADFLKIAGCRAKDVPHTSLSQKLGRIVSDFVMEAKTGFSGKEHNFLRLPAPLSSLDDDKARGICDGEISITPAELASMFQYSVDKTCELLQDQLEQARWHGKTKMKFIFLVGGFAESAYVYAQIKAFGERMGITVIRPACAWSAVVRGAAMKGLEIKGDVLVKNRKCRRSYGTDFAEVFRSGAHPENKSYICSFSGKKMVRDRAGWLLRKGQDLQASETTHAELSLMLPHWPGGSKKMVVDLFASDAKEIIRDITDPNVYKVATLNIDLSSVPEKLFLSRRSPHGSLYHELEFKVEIALESTLEFSVTVDGKQYGSLVADYET